MNAIIEISNDCESHWVPEHSLCEKWLNSALDTANQDEPVHISLSFVDLNTSAELNGQYRNKQSATNVLSFPAEFPNSLSEQLQFTPLGDIVVCPAIVEQEASAQEKELQAHWAHLLVHGLLHLLGYDHESEECAQRMENLEKNALERLGFPDPYLIG